MDYSTKSIGLVNVKVNVIGKLFGLPADPEGSAWDELVVSVPFVPMNFIREEEKLEGEKVEEENGEGDRAEVSNKNQKLDYRRKLQLQTSWNETFVPNGSTWDIYATTISGEVKFKLLLSQQFAEGILDLFPNPFFRVGGFVRLAPAEEEERSWRWSTSVCTTRLHLGDPEISPTDPNCRTFSLPIYSIDKGLLGTNATPKKVIFDLKFSLDWSELWNVPIKSNMDAVFGKMMVDEETKDVIIVARNQVKVTCHWLVLRALSSPRLDELVPGGRPGWKEHRSVEMPELGEEGAKIFLGYLYARKLKFVDVSSVVALELFRVAHRFGMTDLKETAKEVFICNRAIAGWLTPEVAHELFLFVEDLEGLEEFRKESRKMMMRMQRDLGSRDA